MSLLVQKYGGTSLGNGVRLRNVAEIIKKSQVHHQVIVVVSALSSYTKDEGTTSRLLEAGDIAIKNGSFTQILELVEITHFDALQESITDPEICKEVKEYIHQELQSLKSFLKAIQVIKEISPRSQDLIIGTGERLSARLLSGVLKSQGIESKYTDLSECISGQISTNNTYIYQTAS